MATPKIVTVGGGTGHYTLLTGLRDLSARITAIVTMMDSGGSSGRLRDEYGLLPPGDFTRCLVALSEHPDALKELLSHRFRSGSLGGHTLRNLIFTAVQELTGSLPLTVERLHEIFSVKNRVLPVTMDQVDLVMHLENDRTIRGEASIDNLSDMLDAPVLSVYLDPEAAAYPAALEAIADADLIIVGPGDLYTSLVPNLLVKGVREAIAASRARALYVCNLMTKANETPGYTVEDFVGTIAMYLGEARLDAVLFNDVWPSASLREYASTGSEPVVTSPDRPLPSDLLVPADLLSGGKLIRHDPHKLSAAIVSLARERSWW
ncbi:gluconeogenesis factor YvcK family protein [Sorangium sp. So ce406]|uniref:gluconeogenesis factor YvcK family protein n=1 Tax=Sorangium sp. So ce406 TaxID=3133311 RepID=UPI000A83144A